MPAQQQAINGTLNAPVESGGAASNLLRQSAKSGAIAGKETSALAYSLMCQPSESRSHLKLFGEEDVRPTRFAMRQFAEQLPFNTRQVADITLAVAEACVNGVRYGSVEGDTPVVEVTALSAEDHLSIEVHDHGQGFVPATPQMPDASAESGRGIALMHALMDQVAITSTHGGTQVRMIKYFSR